MINNTINQDEYELALEMANESARIRLHRINGTDNIWHMRCVPRDAFLSLFDLNELRTILMLILNDDPNKQPWDAFDKINSDDVSKDAKL